MSQNKEVTVTNLSITPLISNNQTQIIFQRHCDYDENYSLTADSIKDQKEVVKKFMKQLFTQSTVADLQNTFILFVASETASGNNFKRCVETTDIAMRIATEFYKQFGISEEKIVNLSSASKYNQKVKETKHLEGSRIFSNNTGFLDFLLTKHGDESDEFWADFDEDNEAIIREELHTEGPFEIADRGINFVRIIKRYSEGFHRNYPNSKLIVWCGTHYDIISPLVKKEILNLDKRDIVYVDNCGGLSFALKEDGEDEVNLNGLNYPIALPEKNPLKKKYF